MFVTVFINENSTYGIYLKKLADAKNNEFYSLDFIDSDGNIITLNIDKEVAPIFKRDLIKNLELIEGIEI